MLRLLAFALGAAFLTRVSLPALRRPGSHGAPRYVAWLCILALLCLNAPWWDVDRYAPRQLLSWLLLFTSPVLAVAAYRQLRREGRPDATRHGDAALLGFERTSQLVTDGVFRHIRHPMYASLMLLAWGAGLKNLSLLSVALTALATWMLWHTARRDEQECLAHFGAPYAEYMQRSRRFVPGLF